MAWRGSATRKLNVAPTQRSSLRFTTAAAANTNRDNMIIVRNALRLFRAEGVRVTHVSMEGDKIIFGLYGTDQSSSFNNDEPSSAKDKTKLNTDKADLDGFHNLKSAKSPRPRQEPPAMKPITMGGVVMSRTCFKKILRPLRNEFATLFLKYKRWRVLRAKRAASPLPLATVNVENDTQMTERDDIAAAPLHTKRPPAKAPRFEDVFTVPDATIAVRPAWQVMLLRDMNALRPGIRILLEEALLRRPPAGQDDWKWLIRLLQLMAVSIPRHQWDLLLHALNRRYDIDRPPFDRDTVGRLWNAAQPGRELTPWVWMRVVHGD